MGEFYSRSIFGTEKITPRECVVFATETGRHMLAVVEPGETKQSVLDIWRFSTDRGAYAINVKPKVKP